MDSVVVCGSHASRKSHAMSHNSSVGEEKGKMLLLTVIAGELGCLSVITYILSPSPAEPTTLVIGLSDFPHPLSMFSLTPCIYNMLEQPPECKDPSKAISKHRYTCSVIHTGARPSDMI